ncbi:YcnI family protein [Neobacillus citreus]|uniref:YcnI family protein n=1 Tax=Neobacillus citreus TaxID=2833578 RepID=A0A942YC08_9BACI|nr:YcnI family protein [Neobacillus citreus]MCH6267824.1 YcnI family protein [Neobacillus citreus]
MKKLLTFVVTIIGTISLFAGAASAHVTVQPSETSQGKYEVFTVKVPSENEQVPTTKIEVKIPDDVDVTRFEPKPGWKYDVQKDASGKITSVTWTAEGEGLSPTEFAMFNMSGKVGDKAEKIVWKAYQTYQDGSVVEWVGAEDADKPASVTVVHPAAPGEHGHGHGAAQTDKKTDTAADHDQKTEDAASSNVPLYLSIAALLVGLIALGVSFKKKS